MADLHFSRKALDDLSEIWSYTYDTWSETQADRYYSMLLALCKELANKPALGKRYDEIGMDILGCRASQHIIFYHVTSHREIEIVRILHSKMDLKRRMRE